MPKVGIREVAAYAGVSMGSVSHYLNHPSRVSAEKAKRIQEAIDHLGFVRNNAGRQLRLGRSTTVAYIVPDVSNPFFATIAEGVEKRAAQAGLSVFFANSGGDPAREDSYLDLFEEYGVRGMLVASPRPIETRLAALRSRGTPSVLMGRRSAAPAQPSISIDDVSGGRLAAQHLIEVGCRKIAFVGGPLSVPQVADRLQGASMAVRESGSATLEVIEGEPRVVSVGHKVAGTLVERPPEYRPDGVFAVNDMLGIGLVQTLVTGGIQVPEQVAVVGYDDIEYAENSLVPLTSVRSPHESFGVAAVDLLLGLLGEAPAPDNIQPVFSPDLVVRRSTSRRSPTTSTNSH